ncbi:MAG TPA: hypothetical protein VFR94_10690 [Nitrososphaeraceae archaeon]|nr:hypothetical protein [Nitrososphaeraceae archaeon]
MWISIQSRSNEKGNVEQRGQPIYYEELLAIWKNVHEAKMRPKSNNFESYLSTVKVISRIYHYDIISVDMKDSPLRKQIVNLQQKIRQSNIAGFLSVTTGILLVASAGGWDITNHLLNKPESFYSPPHVALYSGVALVIIGTILVYQCQARFRDQERNSKDHSRQRMKAIVDASSLSSLQLSVKLLYLGTTMLVSSGPFDYMWHTPFGLDGLLSPPHALLTVGMAFCSTGALIGILSSSRSLVNDNKNSVAIFQISKIKGIIINDSTIPDNSRKRKISASSPYRPAYRPVFVIIGILPVWLTLSRAHSPGNITFF